MTDLEAAVSSFDVTKYEADLCARFKAVQVPLVALGPVLDHPPGGVGPRTGPSADPSG